MMLQTRHMVIVALCSLVLACNEGGGEDPEISGECTIEQQNRFVHELLLDKYLWYRDVPEVLPQSLSYADFDSADEILDYLKDEKDRFSNITDADEFNGLFNQGQLVRYGFSFLVQNDDTLQVRYVYTDSAAGRALLERGDEILSINGQTVAGLISSEGLTDAFGPNEAGHPVDLQVRKKDGSISDVHMEKSVVNINTVLHHSIQNNGEEDVAYLVFQSFLATSKAELSTVFSEFKAAGVEKIILDLRYNGGGRVDVAQDLASAMVITDNTTDRFALLRYNDKYQQLNKEFLFKTMDDEIDFDQVTIITTGATASASEMIINGLNPFVEVKTVGSTTFGKPVGMNPTEFCDKVILPITFEGVNQLGEGDFFDGIAVDCAAEDNLDFAFGDTDDPMLSEALFVSRKNNCSSARFAQKYQHQNSIKPDYSMQNIIDVY